MQGAQSSDLMLTRENKSQLTTILNTVISHAV